MPSSYSATILEGDAIQILSGAVDAGTDARMVLLVLLISGDGANHVHPNAPTYAGIPMTQIDETFFIRAGDAIGPDNRVASLWRLIGPASGSNTLTVDLDAPRVQVSMAVIAVHGAIGIGQDARANDATGADDTPTVNLTPDNADSLLMAFAGGDAGTLDPYAPGAGMTELIDSITATQTNHSFWVGERAGSGVVTLEATQAGNGEWVIWAVEIDALAIRRVMRSPRYGITRRASVG